MLLGRSFGDWCSEEEGREEESSVEVMGEKEGVGESDSLIVVAERNRRNTHKEVTNRRVSLSIDLAGGQERRRQATKEGTVKLTLNEGGRRDTSRPWVSMDEDRNLVEDLRR